MSTVRGRRLSRRMKRARCAGVQPPRARFPPRRRRTNRPTAPLVQPGEFLVVHHQSRAFEHDADPATAQASPLGGDFTDGGPDSAMVWRTFAPDGPGIDANQDEGPAQVWRRQTFPNNSVRMMLSSMQFGRTRSSCRARRCKVSCTRKVPSLRRAPAQVLLPRVRHQGARIRARLPGLGCRVCGGVVHGCGGRI